MGWDFEERVIEATDVAEAIITQAENYDVVLIGATKIGPFDRLLFGTIPEKVATSCPKTVIMVKRYEGRVRSLLREVIGGATGGKGNEA